MKRRRLLFVVCLLWGAQNLMAQQDNDVLWRELLEQWSEQHDSETVPDDIVEHLQNLMENPVNLNDTASYDIKSLPFLSDFHRRMICSYIAQNGEMVSMNELHILNGMDSITIQLLRCFAKVEPYAVDNESFGQILKKGQSSVVVGGKSMFPQSRGYINDNYEGSPMRLYFRYNFKSGDRVSFLLSGDKDAGEALTFGSRNGVRHYGFDFYGYHFMLKDFGRLRSFVAGKYQLQFGQGATLWSGYAPWMYGATPLRRYGAGMRSASAFCEYGFLRGAAATVSLLPAVKKSKFDLTLFYSNVDRDATAANTDTSDNIETVYQSLIQTGLHRTESELMRKGGLTEQLVGGHIQFYRRSLAVGATTYATFLSNDVRPVDNSYNYFAFRGKRNLNYGVDFAYVRNKLQLFGEIASSAEAMWNDSINTERYIPIAAVAGLQMQLNSNNCFSVAYRYESPNYHNFHANMIGQSASVGNEEGLIMYFKTRLPFYIDMTTSMDFFRYPALRYNLYSPSTGIDYRLNLGKTIAKNTALDIQYRYRRTQRNSDGQLYGVETIWRQQMRMSIEYSPSQTWRFLSRVVCSWFDCESHQQERGFLIMQEVDWKSSFMDRPFVLGARVSLFDISDYDSRIYSYESDMTYEYGVPMFVGRGLRSFIICRYELTSRFSMALKYSINFYPEASSIGSGNDKIEGNRKQEIKAQLRLRF